MKTLIPAAIRRSLMFAAVAALSLAYPASVQAVPTTYQYTGHHFTEVSGPAYTTSMFVKGMVTLAAPLPPNSDVFVLHPLAFTFFDGVQKITQKNGIPNHPGFHFKTDGTGNIVEWALDADSIPAFPSEIVTQKFLTAPGTVDEAFFFTPTSESIARNQDNPGEWSIIHVPDAGSTLSLMTLTLMALGLGARRFKRAAG